MDLLNESGLITYISISSGMDLLIKEPGYGE